MKIMTRVALFVSTLAIALMMTGCGGGGGTDPFTYFKASNTNADDHFGRSVALSDDGTTLAVGANLEDGDGSNQSNNSDSAAGAVYVFTSGWQQQAYIKAQTPAADDGFGFSVALSLDGTTLAVGVPQFYSGTTKSGAVDVFTRSGSTWTFRLRVPGEVAGDGFGSSVALSNDGSVLAVGAPFAGTSAGAIYVYTRSDSTWSSTATTDKFTSSSANDQLGVSVALNGSGTVLAGGANQISSAGPGYAMIFVPTGNSNTWADHTSYRSKTITATGGETNDRFGVSVSLNTTGDMLAVGARWEDSNTISNKSDNTAADSGAAYVFVTSDTWDTATPTETYVKATSPVAGDEFGTSVSLNDSGNTLIVGAPAPAPATKTGTVYRIVNNGTWAGGIASEQVITPPSGDSGDNFGISVSSSASADKLAIGDYFEDSAATGVNGDKTDNSASDSGAAYVYVP